MRLLPVFVIVALSAPALAQEAPPPSLLTIGSTTRPPVIDGVLDDPAWEGAAGFCGMVPIGKDALAADRTTVRVTYTAERIYVAFECALTDGAAPISTAVGHDLGRPWREDAVEVYLAPDASAPADNFQLIGASAGGVFDYRAGDPAWNGAWEFATSVGTHAWTAEASISFAELGVSAPRPGDEWRANFARDVLAGRSSHESWALLAASFKEPERFGRLVFTGDGPIVGVRDLGEPEFGRLVVDAVAANPSNQPAALKLSAWVVEPGTTITATGEEWAPMIRGKMVTAGEDVTIEAGAVQEVTVSAEFTDPALGVTILTATGPDGGQLFAQQLPFDLLTPLSVTLQPVPIHKRLLVRVVSGLEGLDPEATRVRLSATPVAGGAPVAEEMVTLAGAAEASLDYAAWPLGEYSIGARVTDAGGEVHTASAIFEAVPTPEWVENDLGRARVIVPPFEPMTSSESAFRCWGRRTEFARGLLPASLTSQNAELLAGPMRLVVTRGGRTETIEAGATPIFSERAPDRVAFATEGTAAGASAHIDWWAEYDGFTWADLEISAPGGTVDGLALEIPLRAEFARMIHADTNRRHAAVNEFIGDEPFAWGFLPQVWIGDQDRGLCWFAESAESFVPYDGERVVEIVPQGDTVLLRVTMIAAPTELAESRRFGFGLLASPVRALPEGWSTMMIDNWPPERSTLEWEALGTKPDWGVIWNTDYGDHLTAPFATRPIVRDLVALGREWGVGMMHYIAPGCHSMAFEEPRRYLEEWRIDPLDEFYIARYEETYPRLCLNSSFTDYLLSGIDYMIGEFGVEGIYHDGGAPMLCSNEVHGCGWRDENGQLHPIRPIRAYREYHKRLAVLLWHDRGIEDFFVYEHTSDICWLPTLTFCNAHLDGEQYKGRRRAKVPYSEILSRQEILPEYVSTQWGVITVFLNICEREGEEGRTCSATFLGHTLPNGIPFYPRHLYQEWHEQIQVLYHDFDIDRAQFHPYWRELPGFAPNADMEQTPVSCYRHADGRLLVVAGNITDGELAPSVRLDGAALGLAADARILRTIASDVEAELSADTLSLRMPAHSFAMIWIE